MLTAGSGDSRREEALRKDYTVRNARVKAPRKDDPVVEALSKAPKAVGQGIKRSAALASQSPVEMALNAPTGISTLFKNITRPGQRVEGETRPDSLRPGVLGAGPAPVSAGGNAAKGTTYSNPAVEAWQDRQMIVDQKAEEAAEKKAAQGRARDLRKDALKAGETETREMTRDEYNALNAKQRAAVDFNTALVKAVAQDKASAQDYAKRSADQQQTYDKLVEATFGSTKNGSETYAPATMNLLRQIDFKDKLSDLDDFLGLKVAITDDDLGNFAAGDTPFAAKGPDAGLAPGPDARDTDRFSLQSVLTRGREIMEKANTVTEDKNISLLGGKPSTAGITGFGEGKWDMSNPESPTPLDTDAYFQQVFEALADSSTDQARSQELLGGVRGALSEKEFQDFFIYADIRSKMDPTGKTPLGSNPSGSYKTPDEFRKSIGLEK